MSVVCAELILLFKWNGKMKLCKIYYYRENSPKVWCGCTSFFVFYDLFISYTISLLLKMYHFGKKQKQKEILYIVKFTLYKKKGGAGIAQ